MPPGTNHHENGSVSWSAADVAADDSGETTLLGGDIRPTGAGYFPVSLLDHEAAFDRCPTVIE